MPHGRLTPLGKQWQWQLLSVLAHISPTSTLRPRRHHTSSLHLHFTPQWPLDPSQCQPQCQFLCPCPLQHRCLARRLHRSSCRGAATAAAAHVDEELLNVNGSTPARVNENRATLQPDADHPVETEGEPLEMFTRLLIPLNDDETTFSQASPRRPAARTLERVLQDFQWRIQEESDPLAADWENAYKPSTETIALLRTSGYQVAHLAMWADIVNELDPLSAATKLDAAVNSRASPWPPLFIYMGLLERPYLSARALRILIKIAHTLFNHRAPQRQNLPGLNNDALHGAAIRLLRHARGVWPQSLAAIVELVLAHQRSKHIEQDMLPHISRRMNKLLKHVSLTTAERPFKDNSYQEAAMVLVLRFMAEHQPALQIDRDGYRAVIRVQLAQRKTAHDRQWAKLKSLAWPPWKVDRTAMDESIDIGNYGTSKAAQTLTRMQEAGYAPQEWEQNAQIYAGWDVDGTPTIQTRKRQNVSTSRDAWSARIETTRTVQEAWACYLAWEDCNLPHDQHVYLATAQKLREEERRLHVEASPGSDHGTRKACSVQPGDAWEIAPLPPSTHLWTYTRTRPPSMNDFYDHIRARGAMLDGHCLAFFISHANAPASGIRYLKDHSEQCTSADDVLALRSTHGLEEISDSVYGSAVMFFSRMGFVGSADLADRIKHLPTEIAESGLTANYNIGIVRAIELLRLRPNPRRVWYHFVLQGLTREENLMQMAKIKTLNSPGGDAYLKMSDELRQCHGAVHAYRLVLKVLEWQSQDHMDPDSGSFYSFCRAVEIFAVAAWSALQNERVMGNLHDDQYTPLRQLLKLRGEKVSGQDPEIACRYEFKRLVSPSEEPVPELDQAPQAIDLPRLLTTPSPYALHAYVRALGWLANYDGLLEVTQWMHKYRQEIAERRAQDRGGEEAMRRTIVALRVFLERSWLLFPDTNSDSPAAIPPIDPAVYKPIDTGDDEHSGQEEHDNPAGKARDIQTPTSSAEGGVKIRYEVSRDDKAYRLLTKLRTPAKDELILAVRKIVEDVEEWGGWPDRDEVERYCDDRKFGSKPFRKRRVGGRGPV